MSERFRQSTDVCAPLWHFASDKQTWFRCSKTRSVSQNGWLLSSERILMDILDFPSPQRRFAKSVLATCFWWINVRFINLKWNYATCTKPSHNSLKEKKNVMMKSRCCRAHTLTDIQLMEIQHRVRFKISVRLSFQSRRWKKRDNLTRKLEWPCRVFWPE
jgi:hypothetical protein